MGGRASQTVRPVPRFPNADAAVTSEDKGRPEVGVAKADIAPVGPGLI